MESARPSTTAATAGVLKVFIVTCSSSPVSIRRISVSPNTPVSKFWDEFLDQRICYLDEDGDVVQVPVKEELESLFAYAVRCSPSTVRVAAAYCWDVGARLLTSASTSSSDGRSARTALTKYCGRFASSREVVIFNHDAAIDEFMAAVLLTTMPEIDFQGSVVMNGDCIYNYAMQAQYKIQKFLGLSEVSYPITLSYARQWNPFPWAYRGDCIQENAIDCLKAIPNNPQWPPYPDGDVFLEQKLAAALAAKEQITLLVNCPMTTVRNILERNPALERAVKRMIWMGGAIHVPGNLDPTTIPKEIANSKAEWNVFCDPLSVAWVFENTSFPITLFPLDVTNQAKITKGFVDGLKSASAAHPYSLCAYQSYELVASESFYDMWDTLTTSYLTHPEFFSTPVSMKLDVVTFDFWQGTLFTPTHGGRTVDVVLDLKDSAGFYSYMLAQFAR